MIRTISILAASLALAGCVTSAPEPAPAPEPMARTPAVCEAMRPDMPVPELQFHSTKDTPDTVARAKANNVKYRAANARYQAACP